MNEKVPCIVCGAECIEIQIIKDDVVEGYDDRHIELKKHIIVDANLVFGWRERVVCRSCWRTHKEKAIAELWNRAQATIRCRLPAIKNRIANVKQELSEQEKELAILTQQIKDKNPGLKLSVFQSSVNQKGKEGKE